MAERTTERKPFEMLVHIALNRELSHAHARLLSVMVTRMDNRTGAFRQSIRWAIEQAGISKDTATEAFKSPAVLAYFETFEIKSATNGKATAERNGGYKIVFRHDIHRSELEQDVDLDLGLTVGPDHQDHSASASLPICESASADLQTAYLHTAESARDLLAADLPSARSARSTQSTVKRLPWGQGRVAQLRAEVEAQAAAEHEALLSQAPPFD